MNLKLLYLFLSIIFGLDTASSYPYDRENNGTSSAVLESLTSLLINFIAAYDHLLLGFLENVLTWYFGVYKGNINTLRPNYSVIFIFAVFQSAGAIGSYMAIKKLFHLITIMAGICIVSVASIALCYITSKLVQHKNNLKKSDMVFLLFDFLVQFIKVFIYNYSGKTATFGDCVELLSSAICPVVSLILPLIFSKYCDNILKSIPCCFTNNVLTFCGYKQTKFEAKCLFVKQCDTEELHWDSNSCCLKNPKIEIFRHKYESVCFLHYVSGNTHWIVKCFTDLPQNTKVIQNAIRLIDGQQIVLCIPIEDPVETEIDDTENPKVSETENPEVSETRNSDFSEMENAAVNF